MDDVFLILSIILLIWILLFFIVELRIIYRYRKSVFLSFNNLDRLLEDRLNILNNLLGILYDSNRKMVSKLYKRLEDISYVYNSLDINRKIMENKYIDSKIDRIFEYKKELELTSIDKYNKYEKKLSRIQKVINKAIKKYNISVSLYNNRMNVITTRIINKLVRFKEFNYYK